ncbi:hypothetical protein [Streptomyces cyaneofuscatus]|uniref:hypothetical protein n=1 Tax=Streptomyces cyaneofuscatus TaxID=66883 RepID=UPI0033A974C3
MTDTPMTPEYERQIRSHVAEMSNYSLGNLFARDLLAEVDRLRKALSEAASQVAELEDEVGKASAHTHFLERNTLPDLNRQIEHHEDGKARWRKRAEKAEARVADLEARPTVGYAVWCVGQSLGDEAAEHLLDLNPELRSTP